MIKIQMSITPTLPELKRWVEGWEKEALKDLTPFWDKYGTRLVAEELARVFVTEGYGTWAPLSPRYAITKSRLYPGKTILRRRDAYFRSATRKGAAGNFYERDKDKMEWGSDLSWFAASFGYPYPAVHEGGTTQSSMTPPRPVYELAANSQALQNNLVIGLKDWLHKTIEKESRKYFR